MKRTVSTAPVSGAHWGSIKTAAKDLGVSRSGHDGSAPLNFSPKFLKMTLMLFDLGAMTRERFFEEHWRRAPLHIAGGAERFLGFRMEKEEFLDTCDRLEARTPGLVVRGANGLTFAQNMDRASPRLQRVSRDYLAAVAGTEVWFDGVFARQSMGIGSHYDIADTFVLQQRGTKIWRLHAPDFIPRSELRRRMLNETDVDAMYMPDEPIEVELREGDLLYLPMLWVHWGIAVGETVSLSLGFTAKPSLAVLEQWVAHVLPAEADITSPAALLEMLREPTRRPLLRQALWHLCYGREVPGEMEQHGQGSRTSSPRPVIARRLLAPLRQALSHHEEWWSPLPLLWDDGSRDTSKPSPLHRIDQHLSRLLSVLDERELERELERASRSEGAAAPVATSAYARLTPHASAEQLVREAKRWLETAESALPSVEPAAVLQPFASPAVLQALAASAGTAQLEALMRVWTQAYAWVRDDTLRQALATLLPIWTRLSPSQAGRLLARAELRGWLWRATEAMGFTYLPRLESLASQLPALLLPVLADAGALKPGDTVTLPSMETGELVMLPWGCKLSLGTEARGPITVRSEGPVLAFSVAEALTFRVNTQGEPRLEGANSGAMHLERLPGRSSPGLLRYDAHPWVRELFPRGRRAHGLVLTSQALAVGSESTAFLDSVWAGWELLERTWPDAAAAASVAITGVVARVPGRVERESVAPFRGLLATAAQAPALMARTWVSETARRIADDLADVHELTCSWEVPGPHSADAIRRLLGDALAAVAQLSLNQHIQALEAPGAWRESSGVVANLDELTASLKHASRGTLPGRGVMSSLDWLENALMNSGAQPLQVSGRRQHVHEMARGSGTGSSS
jgi:50S ribosomal protein L16 3-hydroxylase